MLHVLHFAYLDPGTGSLLIQSLVGVGAGIALFGRRALTGVGRKAKAVFSKTRNEAEEK